MAHLARQTPQPVLVGVVTPTLAKEATQMGEGNISSVLYWNIDTNTNYIVRNIPNTVTPQLAVVQLVLSLWW